MSAETDRVKYWSSTRVVFLLLFLGLGWAAAHLTPSTQAASTVIPAYTPLVTSPTLPKQPPPRQLPKVGDCVKKNAAQYVVTPCSQPNAAKLLKRLASAEAALLSPGKGSVDLSFVNCPPDTDGVLGMSVDILDPRGGLNGSVDFCVNTKA